MEITESEITCTCAFLGGRAMGMSRRSLRQVSNTSVAVEGRLAGGVCSKALPPLAGGKG